MKKFWLTSTALASTLAFAVSAQAAGPTVSVGGFLDFQAGFNDQDLDTTVGGGDVRDIQFQNDTEIHVKAEGRTDGGLTYGAVIELEADVDVDQDGEGINADKTYLFLEGFFGRVEVGSNTDAAAALRVDASTFASATGGIDGDYYDYVNFGGNRGGFFGGVSNIVDYTNPAFIITPGLPTELRDSAADATKITYYTPRFEGAWGGVQLGLSYTPDQGESGQGGNQGNSGGAGIGLGGWGSEDDFSNYENVFNGGISYSGQFAQVGVAASGTFEIGESESPLLEDLQAWVLGLNVSYAGFTVGGSYGDLDESYTLAAGSGEGDYWTAGVGYEYGPATFSLTYLDSSFDFSGTAENELQVWSVGADYQWAPGLVPYVEVSFFELDDQDTPANDNDGTVFIVGTELTF